ncbi:MAG: TIGR03667 family PPOX class F420-dependent oxidoreductase [Thermomicrobiales bacterium]
MNIDTSTEFGARVAKRLAEDRIIWLTTVGSDGVPQPSPVWFLWDGETALIFSQPGTGKLRNIAANPHVSLHLDGDGFGGNIVVLTGEASLEPDGMKASANPAYVAKYAEGMKRIGMDPESFAAAYSVPMRMRPTHLRGH